MQSAIENRVRRLAIMDLICSIIGLLFHAAAIILIIYFIVRDGHPTVLQNGLVRVIFWMVLLFVTQLRIFVVYMAFNFLRVSNKTGTDPVVVFEQFLAWNRLNVFMILIHIFLVANIFAFIYNCCVVFASRAIRRDLETHIMETVDWKPGASISNVL